MHYFEIVVRESDGAERRGRNDCDPYVDVAQVGPKKSRDNDGNRDQQPTHGGRTGFFLVRLRAFFTDVLRDLELPELPHNGRAHDQHHEKRSQAGKGSPKSQVSKDAERREVPEQYLIKKPVEQLLSLRDCVSRTGYSNELLAF